MKFEWNDDKNSMNIEKHGYDFNDACSLFDGDRIEFLDDRKDYGEPRYITLGYVQQRVAVAVYTKRSSDTIRIISLRKANSREKERFENAIKQRLGQD